MEDFEKIDWEINLVWEFIFIKPTIKFYIWKKNVDWLNRVLDDFFTKVDNITDDRQLVHLSNYIFNSDLNDALKARLLNQVNIIMYNLHNNKVLKAEMDEIKKAFEWKLI